MKMHSISARPVAFPLLVTLGITLLLLPLALYQQLERGPSVVVVSGMVVWIVILMTAGVQHCFPHICADPLKQLALVGGLRFVFSLVAVLLAFLLLGSLPRPEALLYAVPTYLGLLAAESAVLVRQIRTLYPG